MAKEIDYDTRLCAWLHPDAEHVRACTPVPLPPPGEWNARGWDKAMGYSTDLDEDRYAPDGTLREAVTEGRLQEVGEAVRRTAQYLETRAPGHAQALDDIADYLVGTYGAPGTYWPQRLPITPKVTA